MSVFEVSGTSIVTSLYDKLRGLLSCECYEYGRHRATALVVSFDVSFSHHGFGPDGNTPHEYGERHLRKYVHFVLTGNVHVWCYTGPEWDIDRISPDEWHNTSNHDSCWRSDGINTPLSQLYFESCDYVQQHLPERLQKCPHDVSKYIAAGRFLGEDLFDFVQIEFQKSETDDYGYDITAMKPLDTKLSLV